MSTLQEVVDRVRRLFGDEDAAVAGTGEVVDYVNEAIRQIAQDTDGFFSALTTGGTTSATGTVSLDVDMLRISSYRIHIGSSTPGDTNALKRIVPLDPANYRDSYESTEPLGYWPLSQGTIQLHPRVVSQPYWQIVEGIVVPANISNLGNSTGFDRQVEDALVRYALYMLYLKVGDTGMSSAAYSDYNRKVANINYHRQNPVMFDYATVKQPDVEPAVIYE
jgi:hypothetical protein